MSLKYGKNEVGSMADVLEAEHETVEQAAKATLLAAETVFEKRAKFTVVGQLRETKNRRNIPPEDPEAIKVCLGFYSTEGDARTAADSLWHNATTGDVFRTWVLPIHHGTAADMHAIQRAKYEEQAEKSKVAATERLRASIAKRQEDDAIRAAGGKGSCANCGHLPFDHRPEGQVLRSKCGLSDCGCDKFREITK